MRILLVPPGRGRWSPIVVTYDPKRRGEAPIPLTVKVGDRVPLFGREFRVQAVEA